jgi:hypothetical protein
MAVTARAHGVNANQVFLKSASTRAEKHEPCPHYDLELVRQGQLAAPRLLGGMFWFLSTPVTRQEPARRRRTRGSHLGKCRWEVLACAPHESRYVRRGSRLTPAQFSTSERQQSFTATLRK